ncbi:Multidrug resistance-associated protein [Blattamonas nauphoetae]|uniref:Multidrug resistance-associated protein n=1 Tax=Blattamonas nauphoetae TaxID=2049346 RepID=A0ABQ9Y7F8_9EUKA|nr:Multidrug resistance-associated protein [Blattamonas nauphoetae]
MASAGSADSGRILSLVSTDSRIIAEMMPMFLMIFVLPVYIVVPLIFLIIDFQWIVLVALGASFVILIPNFFIISGAIGYIKEYMAHNDLQNKITNETFQGIRVVKYSGLEEVFKATINKPRFLQIASIQKMILLFQIMATVMRTSSVIVNISTFSVYCAVKSDDPVVFTTVVMPNMAYLQMITQPTTMMPMFLQAGAMMNVNLRRLQQYLFLPEMEEVASGEDSKPSDPENDLEISGGEFKWGAAPAIPMTEAETEQLKKEAEKRKKEARQAAAKREKNTTVPSDQANTEMTQVPPANPEPTSTPSELGVSEYPRSDSNDTLFKQAQDESSTEGNDDASSNPTPLSSSPSPSRSSSAMSGKDGPALSDVNISIPKGSLTMIVGPVGCGKSSLGSAIVGDIEKMAGTIRIDGKITYCPQTPWINNNTVRGNIVFNAEFEEEKYWNTVHVCALEPDFKIFAAGDETAIGEKGVNMSGGQKARIQLARAVYSDKDIIILDDPLSAVDAHVGRVLMDECICGVLKGKTVILMTNQLQFLDRADKVIVLETGRIIGQGTYGELKGQGINFDEFIIKSEGKKDGKQAKKKDVEVKEEEKTDEEFAKQIMTEEEQETGAISPRSYYLYFKTLMPTVLIIAFILYLAIGESISPASQWWLGKIGSTTEYMNIDFWWKIGIYGFFGIGTFVLLFTRSFMTAAMVGRSARINHQVLMDRVMDCPSSFFDTTPMGRILNRFTGDIPQVDQFLANSLIQVLSMWVGLVGQIVVIVIDTAWFLAIGIPILVLYILVLMLYARVSRNLQRLESISRSPVLSHFSETITGAGLTTIRSYGREEEWKEKFNELNDEWTTRFVLFSEGQKWASLYASFISSALYTGVMIIGWFFMDAARLSVAIMSSMIFTMLGINLIQQNVELESKMTSFDRIKFYSSKLPQEAQGSEVEVPESWPPVGDVTFDAVKFKYRPGLPFVLKGVNFEIKGGEKIGVCGRTGAGKSSLLFVLFRLVELDPKLAPRMIDMKTGFPVDADPNDEPNSGRILIDGVDISKVNIHRVRRSVAIIPQDPTLFTGTVRYNMDIAGKASDG